MELSIILVNYNEHQYLESTLRHLIEEFSGRQTEILVVDNASKDGSVEMVHKLFPAVRLIATGQNLMFGKGNNEGLRVTTGDWILLLNPDVQWESGQLLSLLERAKTRVGIIVPRLLFPDGRLQSSAHKRFPTAWTVFVDYCLPLQQLFMRTAWHPYLYSAAEHEHSHAIAHATGVCLIFPRSVYNTIGGFDPDFTMYLEETEWQKRAADQGIERWYECSVMITHFGSAAKTFAQAGSHYLWGLRRYVTKHWSGSRPVSRLQLALWSGTVISLLVLLIGYVPSVFLGQKGQRIRHYLSTYVRLLRNLIRFPVQAPSPS